MSTWSRSCVLVPIDFSDASFAALAEARQIVDEPSHLHVLHVLVSLHPADPAAWGSIGQDQRMENVQTALTKKLVDRGLAEAQVHVRMGDPGTRIAEVARSIDSDLIVISSHGRTGLGRLLLGSVAERTTRLASCPVLIIRPPDPSS